MSEHAAENDAHRPNACCDFHRYVADGCCHCGDDHLPGCILPNDHNTGCVIPPAETAAAREGEGR